MIFIEQSTLFEGTICDTFAMPFKNANEFLIINYFLFISFAKFSTICNHLINNVFNSNFICLFGIFSFNFLNFNNAVFCAVCDYCVFVFHNKDDTIGITWLVQALLFEDLYVFQHH
jgi:hypothetical protein